MAEIIKTVKPNVTDVVTMQNKTKNREIPKHKNTSKLTVAVNTIYTHTHTYPHDHHYSLTEKSRISNRN